MQQLPRPKSRPSHHLAPEPAPAAKMAGQELPRLNAAALMALMVLKANLPPKPRAVRSRFLCNPSSMVFRWKFSRGWSNATRAI